MKKIFLTLPLFVFVCFSLHAQTQNTDPILAMRLTLQTIGADTAVDGSALPPDSILTEAKMNIALTDTAGISKMYVKLGSTEGSGDLFTQTFNYDAANAAYSRSAYDVQITLGQYYGLTRYYSSVRIERTNNSMTDVIPFSR